MQRVTLRIPKQQVQEVEDLVEQGEFPSRSEAIRAGIRELLKEHRGGRDQDRRPWSDAITDGGRPADRDPSRDQPDYYRDWSQR